MWVHLLSEGWREYPAVCVVHKDAGQQLFKTIPAQAAFEQCPQEAS